MGHYVSRQLRAGASAGAIRAAHWSAFETQGETLVHRSESKIYRIVLSTALLFVAAVFAAAQAVPVVTGDARVDKLLSQMTLEEKITLIHGTNEDARSTRARPATWPAFRGWAFPGLRFADGPPGVLTRHPFAGRDRHHGRGRHLQRQGRRGKRHGDRPRRPRAGHRCLRCSPL